MRVQQVLIDLDEQVFLSQAPNLNAANPFQALQTWKNGVFVDAGQFRCILSLPTQSIGQHREVFRVPPPYRDALDVAGKVVSYLIETIPYVDRHKVHVGIEIEFQTHVTPIGVRPRTQGLYMGEGPHHFFQRPDNFRLDFFGRRRRVVDVDVHHGERDVRQVLEGQTEERDEPE